MYFTDTFGNENFGKSSYILQESEEGPSVDFKPDIRPSTGDSMTDTADTRNPDSDSSAWEFWDKVWPTGNWFARF